MILGNILSLKRNVGVPFSSLICPVTVETASNGDKVERNCGDVANATGGSELPLYCTLCRTNKMFDEPTLRPVDRIRPVIYRIVVATALKEPTQTELITSPVGCN